MGHVQVRRRIAGQHSHDEMKIAEEKTGNTGFYDYRIFIAALAVSFVLHLFWISFFKVVEAPIGRSGSGFSKVSFLGPASAKGSLGIMAQPTARTVLERRYVDNMVVLPSFTSHRSDEVCDKYDGLGAGVISVGEKTARLIGEVLGGTKAEPPQSYAEPDSLST